MGCRTLLRRTTEFRHWLKSEQAKHGPNKLAGYTRYTCRCPIARFLKACTGKKHEVYGLSIMVDGDKFHVPQWVTSFVERVDSMSNHRDRSKRISVSKALYILDTLNKPRKSLNL